MALEDNAKKRIDYIAKRQELLASAVNSLQASLYESVLANFDKIADDPAKLDQLFRQFQASKHAKVIQTFAADIMQVGRMNAEYFAEVAADLDSKDYAPIKKEANQYLMNRFGLESSGKAAKDGFLDTFVKDQSILRELKQYGYKSQAAGIGVEEFKQGFKDMIVGTEAKNGSLMRYYQTFAFDTYQQADATIQDFYAKKLELEAALYLGGEITGTRLFCHERNGKVFLRSEIESWRGLKFQGKPANYDPFQDRGGYNCRHHFNWITNRQAVRRRSDLEIGTDGKLRIKGASGEAKPAEVAKVPEASGFKPAASIKEAEEFALKNGLANRVEWGEKTNKFNQLDKINAIQKRLVELKKENPIETLEFLGVENMGGSFTGTRMSSNKGVLKIDPSTLLDKNLSVDNYSGLTNGFTYSGSKQGIEKIEIMVTHEYGHILSDQKTRSISGEGLLDNLKRFGVSKTGAKDLYKSGELDVIKDDIIRSGYDSEDLKIYFDNEEKLKKASRMFIDSKRKYLKNFTEYGYYNLNESIAEAYAAKKHNLKIDPAILEILNVLGL